MPCYSIDGLNEAEIGLRSIVVACAFVPMECKVPERSLVLGAPAKVMRHLSDEKISRKQAGTLATSASPSAACSP